MEVEQEEEEWLRGRDPAFATAQCRDLGGGQVLWEIGVVWQWTKIIEKQNLCSGFYVCQGVQHAVLVHPGLPHGVRLPEEAVF